MSVRDNIGRIDSKTKFFKIPALHKGDIIFCNTYGWGGLIPGFYTHCAIYIGKDKKGNGKLIETVYLAGHGLPSNGIGVSDLTAWKYPIETCVAVYRPRLTKEMREDAVIKARGFTRYVPHMTYDLNVLQKSQTPDSMYCSELVWAAYSLASGGKVSKDLTGSWTDIRYGKINLGMTSLNPPLGITPSDIAADPRLRYVAGHWEDEPGSPV